MNRQKEKEYRYGMEAFLLLMGLMLAEMLLVTFWEPFAAIPEITRSLFALLGGLAYFLLRCAASAVPVGRSYGWDAAFGLVFGVLAVWRVIDSFLHAEELAPESLLPYRVFFLLEAVLFAASAALNLVHLVRQHKPRQL